MIEDYKKNLVRIIDGYIEGLEYLFGTNITKYQYEFIKGQIVGYQLTKKTILQNFIKEET